MIHHVQYLLSVHPDRRHLQQRRRHAASYDVSPATSQFSSVQVNSRIRRSRTVAVVVTMEVRVGASL